MIDIDKDLMKKYIEQKGFDTKFIDLDFLGKFLGSVGQDNQLDWGFLLALTGLATLRGKELDKFARYEKLPSRKLFEKDDKYVDRVRSAYLAKRGFDKD